MKYLMIILNLMALDCLGQSALTFDKRLVECEDHWVVLPMAEDSSHTFGFVYIDEDAGWTFDMGGRFKLVNEHPTSVEKSESQKVKVRLEANNRRVAFIPQAMYQDLQIEPIPDWLQFYKTDTGSVKRLYKWGYLYNGWNDCGKALAFLEKARELDPNYEGLSVELAYSYNCLEKYGEAESILEYEIKQSPDNPYVNKEYIFALVKNKKIDEASQQYRASAKRIKDKTYDAENCYNILQYFYTKKDKKSFNAWYKELSRCTITNKLISEYADDMKKSMDSR